MHRPPQTRRSREKCAFLLIGKLEKSPYSLLCNGSDGRGKTRTHRLSNRSGYSQKIPEHPFRTKSRSQASRSITKRPLWTRWHCQVSAYLYGKKTQPF